MIDKLVHNDIPWLLERVKRVKVTKPLKLVLFELNWFYLYRVFVSPFRFIILYRLAIVPKFHLLKLNVCRKLKYTGPANRPVICTQTYPKPFFLSQQRV